MPVPFLPVPIDGDIFRVCHLHGLACREARTADRNAANWNKTDHSVESKRHYCEFIVWAMQPKQLPNNLYHQGAYPRRLNLSGETSSPLLQAWLVDDIGFWTYIESSSDYDVPKPSH